MAGLGRTSWLQWVLTVPKWSEESTEISVCQEENAENLINEGHREEELEQILNLPEHEHSFSTEGGRTYQNI